MSGLFCYLDWCGRLDSYCGCFYLVGGCCLLCCFCSLVAGEKPLPFQPPACDKWLETCIGLAFKTKSVSLIESLVYVLGSKFKTYSDLVELAREVSPTYANLREALVKEGLMPPLANPAPDKCPIAGKNLFGAIRRNEIKAVRGLMARGADLTVKDEMARTPVEYAQSLAQARLDIVAIIDPESFQEGAAAETDKPDPEESDGQSE